jgi:hypothetical protein
MFKVECGGDFQVFVITQIPKTNLIAGVKLTRLPVLGLYRQTPFF